MQRYAGAPPGSVYNHMYIPRDFGEPVQNFWNLVTTATPSGVSVERRVEITGPDAARFTQLLTPRNLSQCAVGQVPSAFCSPRLEANMALTMIRIEHIAIDTRVEVGMPSASRAARVVAKPFYDPGKSLAKGWSIAEQRR